MQLQESGEMYLETILILSQKMKNVRSIDVCEYMNFSKPSVSRAMSILRNAGYVETDSSGYLVLTGSGLEMAQRTYERHRTLTELFEKLGVSHEASEQDACRIEHCISEETFDALKKLKEKL